MKHRGRRGGRILRTLADVRLKWWRTLAALPPDGLPQSDAWRVLEALAEMTDAMKTRSRLIEQANAEARRFDRAWTEARKIVARYTRH